MGTFDSIYLNKIRRLEEENQQLKNILNEYSGSRQNRKELIDVSAGKNLNSEIKKKREKLKQDQNRAREGMLKNNLDAKVKKLKDENDYPISPGRKNPSDIYIPDGVGPLPVYYS